MLLCAAPAGLCRLPFSIFAWRSTQRLRVTGDPADRECTTTKALGGGRSREGRETNIRHGVRAFSRWRSSFYRSYTCTKSCEPTKIQTTVIDDSSQSNGAMQAAATCASCSRLICSLTMYVFGDTCSPIRVCSCYKCLCVGCVLLVYDDSLCVRLLIFEFEIFDYCYRCGEYEWCDEDRYGRRAE